MSAAFLVTSILGETKPVEHVWPDGSHQCPFCGYAATAQCDNPACPASRHATPANRPRFEQAARQNAERVAAERARELAMARSLARMEAERAEAVATRRAWQQQVIDAGGCLSCSAQHRNKIRRHRINYTCPKARRNS